MSRAENSRTEKAPARARQYWLMKSEPDEASIDTLAKEGTLPWTGVRNYQARNFMRDVMRIGDGVLFYHSSCASSPALRDSPRSVRSPIPTRPSSMRRATTTTPRRSPMNRAGSSSTSKYVRKSALIPLAELRAHEELADMVVLRRGNRLSITPVTPAEWRFITTRLMD
ncbi:EVE domain-containing protein [Cupriavidus basilensis]